MEGNLAPIAMLLVKDGSRGDKLLFRYPYCTPERDDAQVVECSLHKNGTINNMDDQCYFEFGQLCNHHMDQDTDPFAVTVRPASSITKSGYLTGFTDKFLSNLLAVKAELYRCRFELQINDVRFIGHPMALESQQVSLQMCHLAIVVNADLSPEIVNGYYSLCERLAVGLRYMDYNKRYLTDQVNRMLELHEAATARALLQEFSQDPYDDILGDCDLAKNIAAIFHRLCDTGGYTMSLDNWFNVSFVMPYKVYDNKPVGKYFNFPHLSRRRRRLLRYMSVLLLTERSSFESDQFPLVTPSIRRVMDVASATSTLYKTAMDADIIYTHLVDIVAHFVHWGMMMVIYPVCYKNVYIMSSKALDIVRSHRLPAKYRSKFPHSDRTLLDLLEVFGAPTTPLDLAGAASTQERKYESLYTILWLLECGLIYQVHKYVYITVPINSGTKKASYVERLIRVHARLESRSRAKEEENDASVGVAHSDPSQEDEAEHADSIAASCTAAGVVGTTVDTATDIAATAAGDVAIDADSDFTGRETVAAAAAAANRCGHDYRSDVVKPLVRRRRLGRANLAVDWLTCHSGQQLMEGGRAGDPTPLDVSHKLPENTDQQSVQLGSSDGRKDSTLTKPGTDEQEACAELLGDGKVPEMEEDCIAEEIASLTTLGQKESLVRKDNVSKINPAPAESVDTEDNLVRTVEGTFDLFLKESQSKEEEESEVFLELNETIKKEQLMQLRKSYLYNRRMSIEGDTPNTMSALKTPTSSERKISLPGVLRGKSTEEEDCNRKKKSVSWMKEWAELTTEKSTNAEKVFPRPPTPPLVGCQAGEVEYEEGMADNTSTLVAGVTKTSEEDAVDSGASTTHTTADSSASSSRAIYSGDSRPKSRNPEGTMSVAGDTGTARPRSNDSAASGNRSSNSGAPSKRSPVAPDSNSSGSHGVGLSSRLELQGNSKTGLQSIGSRTPGIVPSISDRVVHSTLDHTPGMCPLTTIVCGSVRYPYYVTDEDVKGTKGRRKVSSRRNDLVSTAESGVPTTEVVRDSSETLSVSKKISELANTLQNLLESRGQVSRRQAIEEVISQAREHVDSLNKRSKEIHQKSGEISGSSKEDSGKKEREAPSGIDNRFNEQRELPYKRDNAPRNQREVPSKPDDASRDQREVTSKPDDASRDQREVPSRPDNVSRDDSSGRRHRGVKRPANRGKVNGSNTRAADSRCKANRRASMANETEEDEICRLMKDVKLTMVEKYATMTLMGHYKHTITMDDFRTFIHLCDYFRGEHHVEEMMYSTNLSRSRILEVVDKFGLMLCVVERPAMNYPLNVD